MEELHTIVVKTEKLPSGLKTAEEISDLVGSISADRIMELANSGYMPHYRIDGGTPIFKVSEVKDWLACNLLAKSEGRPFPNAIRVVIAAPEVINKPPTTISNVPNLQQLPKHGYQPGVYFLCKDDKVVYVGQSVTPGSRVGQHVLSPEKDFDRVYLIPVPHSELDDVEATFIHLLLPSQQGGVKSGRNPMMPKLRCKIGEIVNSTKHYVSCQNNV